MTRESTLLTSTPYTIRRVLASSLSSFLASVGTERIFGQRRKGDVSGSRPGILAGPAHEGDGDRARGAPRSVPFAWKTKASLCVPCGGDRVFSLGERRGFLWRDYSYS